LHPAARHTSARL